MGNIRFENGNVLFDSGVVAMDAACCCTVEPCTTCADLYANCSQDDISITVANVAGSPDVPPSPCSAGDCDDFNGTYTLTWSFQSLGVDRYKLWEYDGGSDGVYIIIVCDSACGDPNINIEMTLYVAGTPCARIYSKSSCIAGVLEGGESRAFPCDCGNILGNYDLMHGQTNINCLSTGQFTDAGDAVLS